VKVRRKKNRSRDREKTPRVPFQYPTKADIFCSTAHQS